MKTILQNTLLITGSLLSTVPLYAQQVGIGTSTPKAFFNVIENRDVLFGTDVNGSGNKLIWYGSKAAFRAGSSGTTQWNNSEVGQGSFAAGFNTRASGVGSTALGNASEATNTNSLATGFNTRASGVGSTALGNASVASGLNTTAMGFSSTASGETATAIGNSAQAPGVSAISIGTQTSAGGPYSTALGFATQSTGEFATAIGNTVEASGRNSIALGTNVSTNERTGSIIIGDASSNRYESDGNQKMTMRFGGGYVLYSYNGPQRLGDPFFIPPGVELRPGQNAWFVISDSTKKENYRSVDGASVLKKISQMRLGSWNYRGQDPKLYRHYGPMAQDFFAAFGHDALGTVGEPTGINQGDFDGVNLIAIKALIAEVDQLKAELAASRDREKTTQARLDKIEALLGTSAGVGTASPKPQAGR
ncbi:tail fiber domain-containing protein [Spirosoma soli]|uniref:Tail fiber domain-containing protein n=1 Tax=Spirosoma soli TaxID=1770529 RepID=A0ABW5MA64_9BACT